MNRAEKQKKTKRGVQPPLFLEHIVWFPPGILAKSPAKSMVGAPSRNTKRAPRLQDPQQARPKGDHS